jgi:hypothetical protein
VGMKRDTLFEHKEATITCEKNMGDVNEYWKLLESPTKQEKASKGRQINLIYNQCNKSRHSKERCHWNLDNQTTNLRIKMR